MNAAVRRYRVSDIDELVQRVEAEFVDQVKGVDGFVGYYVVDGGDGTAVSVTVGETAEAVEQSTALARDWVQQHATELIEGAPEVTSGEVRVSVER